MSCSARTKGKHEAHIHTQREKQGLPFTGIRYTFEICTALALPLFPLFDIESRYSDRALLLISVRKKKAW